MDNFDPYNVLLSIATNIPVLLMTAFVLQDHIYVASFCDYVNKLVNWTIPWNELSERTSYAEKNQISPFTTNAMDYK